MARSIHLLHLLLLDRVSSAETRLLAPTSTQAAYITKHVVTITQLSHYYDEISCTKLASQVDSFSRGH